MKSVTELVLSLIAIVFGIWKGDAQLRGFLRLCWNTNRTLAFLLPLILVVLWNGAVCTAFPMWAQAVGQASVGPTEASLIYATQPVWNTYETGQLLQSDNARSNEGAALEIYLERFESEVKMI